MKSRNFEKVEKVGHSHSINKYIQQNFILRYFKSILSIKHHFINWIKIFLFFSLLVCVEKLGGSISKLLYVQYYYPMILC